MAEVQNRTCMACYTEITAQALNNLSIGQFILCKNCGRALYLPE
jgi:predicted  nucleic acid-binding Zn-ribbon protein